MRSLFLSLSPFLKVFFLPGRRFVLDKRKVWIHTLMRGGALLHGGASVALLHDGASVALLHGGAIVTLHGSPSASLMQSS